MNPSFWSGKKVFLTGHTGFKGSWLAIWLLEMGAEVCGYSLEPNTYPSNFIATGLKSKMNSVIGDIRDKEKLVKTFSNFKPEIVIHMAAQPLVRESYVDPLSTYEINVMGTVNLMECIKGSTSVRAVVNVTTDKCYENKEWYWGYRENESLGGYDPYSSSKACSELVTAAYRSSFFNPSQYESHRIGIASARAGNVIGGGDWAKDRIVPDSIRSLLTNQDILIRNPFAIRPWQHVLEPLSGYLVLAEKLYEDGARYAQAWNFGPEDDDAKPVKWIVNNLINHWGSTVKIVIDSSSQPHEAHYLKLDISKAKFNLQWKPTWSLTTALQHVTSWFKAYEKNEDMYLVTKNQILDYMRENNVSI